TSAVTPLLAAADTAALALSRHPPDAPDHGPHGASHLPERWAGRAPPEGDPPAHTAAQFRDASPRSWRGSTAYPTLARASESPQYQSLSPCHPAGPPRDSEPPGCLALGQAPMSRPALEVADVVRQYGAAYLARYGATVSPEQHRALRAIAVCRTAALGGHATQCEQCGHLEITYNSCGNRHCPKCPGRAQAAWLAARE